MGFLTPEEDKLVAAHVERSRPLIEEIAKLRKALEDIAEGMVPRERLDAILELTREGKLAEARGALYGWCQERAKEALRLSSH